MIQEPKKQKKKPKELRKNFTPEEYDPILKSRLLGNHWVYGTLHQSVKWNDKRLNYLDHNLFHEKTVLDLGCNEGILTLPIAIKFSPKLIRGIDIDRWLIKKCQKHKEKFIGQNSRTGLLPLEEIEQLPACFQFEINKLFNYECYRLDQYKLKIEGKKQSQFPNNVQFRVENALAMEGPQFYDCILCMRVTKWIHLAFGDDGIKGLFENIGNKLSDNGVLVLEAQPWSSYYRKRNLNPSYSLNYNQITFKPDRFKYFLKSLGLYLIKSFHPAQLKYEVMVFQKKNLVSEDISSD